MKKKQFFFLDNRPFIYIFSGLLGYALGIWLVFSGLELKTATVKLNENGSLQPTEMHHAVQNRSKNQIVDSLESSMNWHPAYLKWGLFIGLLMAFASAILVSALRLNMKIVYSFSLWKSWYNILIFSYAVVLAIFFIGFIISGVSDKILIPDEIFRNLELISESNLKKLSWISPIIFCPGILCLSGLLLLNLAIVDRNADENTDEDYETGRQIELQRYFRFFSISLSILITGGMVTSSLLRDVVYSVIVPLNQEVVESPEWKALAPSEFILIYGLNQVVILTAVLVPSFFYIHRSGQMALNRIQSDPSKEGAQLAKQFSPQRMLLQKVWLISLILMPFWALFASRLLNFLAKLLD